MARVIGVKVPTAVFEQFTREAALRGYPSVPAWLRAMGEQSITQPGVPCWASLIPPDAAQQPPNPGKPSSPQPVGAIPEAEVVPQPPPKRAWLTELPRIMALDQGAATQEWMRLAPDLRGFPKGFAGVPLEQQAAWLEEHHPLKGDR